MTATPEPEIPLDCETPAYCLEHKIHDTRTEREILLDIESVMIKLQVLGEELIKEAAPMIQQVSGHAMFRMFFGKVKSGE